MKRLKRHRLAVHVISECFSSAVEGRDCTNAGFDCPLIVGPLNIPVISFRSTESQHVGRQANIEHDGVKSLLPQFFTECLGGSVFL